MRAWPMSVALALTACASTPPAEEPSKVFRIDADGVLRGPDEDSEGGSFAIDVAELEIRANGVDRFARCPPPAEIGRAWYPPPFPIDWQPLVDPRSRTSAQGELEPSYYASSATDNRSPVQRAVEDTHRAFRQCYRRGTIRGPVEGHAAIVVRLDKNGRTIRVEEYAACALATETIQCMKDIAGRLRFDPPANGSQSITIPARFDGRDGEHARSTGRDAYTVGAYVTVESARPLLHACDREVRVNMRPVEATAAITLTVVKDGHVENANVDEWEGNQDLIVCAAKAMATVKFEPPPGGKAFVSMRLSMNPAR